MQPLLDLVLEKIPGPEVDPNASLQMLVTNLDWSEYIGRIAVGRIQAGTLKTNQQIDLCKSDGPKPAQVASVWTFNNLGRVEVPEVTAGDIAQSSG